MFPASLSRSMGGPSVRPYQPEGLYKDMLFSNMTNYAQEKGEGLWRRSLYTFWKRTVMPPAMQVFDASSREYCTVRETRTNTPLQALNLMNDTTYVEAARLMAQRMMTEGGSKLGRSSRSRECVSLLDDVPTRAKRAFCGTTFRCSRSTSRLTRRKQRSCWR